MKKLLFVISIFMCTLFGSQAYAAPEMEAIPEEVFQWVQSSSRMDYYFNRQQMHFGKDSSGNVDTNQIVVPTLKIYDDLMRNDVLSKRRWNGKSMERFSELAGVAEYLVFDLKAKTVTTKRVEYLDYTFTTIEQETPDQVTKMEELSHQSFAYKFYTAILDYGLSHQVDLAKRVNSKLDPKLEAKLLEAQKAYKPKK